MKFWRQQKESEEKPPRRQKFMFQNNMSITLNSNNLAPVILQEETTREVLHLGYMDRWALNTSLERGIVYLYRRSRGRLEIFGGKNNLEYKIKSIKLDRSRRSLLIMVAPIRNTESKLEEMGSFVDEVELPKPV